jgi:hypothetical protein
MEEEQNTPDAMLRALDSLQMPLLTLPMGNEDPSDCSLLMRVKEEEEGCQSPASEPMSDLSDDAELMVSMAAQMPLAMS